MRFKYTLSLQLALIFAGAVVLILLLGLLLEISFQSSVNKNRSLGIARNHAANAIPMLARAPEDLRADLVRSYSTPANQFFLLPEIMTAPDAVRLPELEAETEAWIARRQVAVRQVYVAQHQYPRTHDTAFKPKGGVADRQAAIFKIGNTPRVRMGDVVSHPPSWVPIVATAEGAQRKPPPDPKPDAEISWREIITVAFQLEATGDWLLFYHYNRPPPNNGAYAKFNIGLVGALFIALVALLIGHRIMAPFKTLAKSAHQLGRGDRAETIPLSGPSDVRAVISAFNRMNDRVSQSIDYQTGLLRSLGHDIKGPLEATQRLLGDVEPVSTRVQIDRRLESIRSMLASILSFSHAILRDGRMQRTDLVEMLETLVAEQQESGAEAALRSPESLPISCCVKPTERALRNLLVNAIQYGQRAQVTLGRRENTAVIWIDDDGPGLPAEMLEEVFTPFQRHATDSEGSGLGLAIARTIAVDQGGTVRLVNRPEGGLRAEFCLPI